jgi:hypothetical protein
MKKALALLCLFAEFADKWHGRPEFVWRLAGTHCLLWRIHIRFALFH